MDNSITMSGNLTTDPALRYTPSGHAVIQFDIANNRRWRDGAGEQQEEVTYIQVQAWRGLAEHVAKSAKKGMRVTVSGRLAQNTWTADDGTTRSRMRIEASDIAVSLLFGIVTGFERDRPNANTEPAPITEGSEPVSQEAPAGAPDGEEPF